MWLNSHSIIPQSDDESVNDVAIEDEVVNYGTAEDWTTIAQWVEKI